MVDLVGAHLRVDRHREPPAAATRRGTAASMLVAVGRGDHDAVAAARPAAMPPGPPVHPLGGLRRRSGAARRPASSTSGASPWIAASRSMSVPRVWSRATSEPADRAVDGLDHRPEPSRAGAQASSSASPRRRGSGRSPRPCRPRPRCRGSRPRPTWRGARRRRPADPSASAPAGRRSLARLRSPLDDLVAAAPCAGRALATPPPSDRSYDAHRRSTRRPAATPSTAWHAARPGSRRGTGSAGCTASTPKSMRLHAWVRYSRSRARVMPT